MRFAASVVQLDDDVDLVDVVAAARDAGLGGMLIERELPEPAGVAGVGRVLDIVAAADGVQAEDASGRVLDREAGEDRLIAAARLWERLAADVGDGPLLAVGGFGFRTDRDPGPPWQGFPALLLRVPELLVQRGGGRAIGIRVRHEGAVGHDAPSAGRVRRTDELLAELLREQPFRAPHARRLITTPTRPPHQWLAAVEAVVEQLSHGRAIKVVLARELVARGDGPVDARSVLTSLRDRYPSCFTFLVPGADGSALVGASPELLLRRRGGNVVSQPMAGSAARGVDADEDERMAAALLRSAKDRDEHAVMVTQMLERFHRAGAHAVQASEVAVARFANIQHLTTTIGAEFTDPAPTALDLCAAVHPTAAVGGEPWQEAARLIDEYEEMDRGWYAGAVGWTDAKGDGEFAVTLRCGLLWEDGVRLYAGAGLTRDSDPASELAETDLKFVALLDALRGSHQPPPPKQRDDPPRSQPARSAHRRSRSAPQRAHP